MTLKGNQRSHLSRLAHGLSPVVMVGGDGVSPGVLRAVDEALECHELIKVKFQDHKEARHSLAPEIARKEQAILVRIVGNIAIFYRTARKPENRKLKFPV